MTRLECGCEIRIAYRGLLDDNHYVSWCDLHRNAAETLRQRDRLLEALKALYSDLQRISSPDTRWERPTAVEARAAIADVEGTK